MATKAKNREAFFSFLQNLVTSGRMKVAHKIPLDSKIVVVRVRDFDKKSNDFWQNQANKSYPREGLACSECKEPVVMSDGMLEMYNENPDPKMIVCGKCAFNI